MSQLNVMIMGQSFALTCKEGEEGALLQAVRYLDQRMSAIRDAGRIKGNDRIAVIAALGMAAELLATRRDQLAKNAKGLPKIEASDTRQLIIGHLAQALPAREAGAEVSLAIAGVAADSLS